LVLRKAKGGKKEILIETVKDKETGKIKYGTKSSMDDELTRTASPERAVSPKPGGKTELRMFKGSLLDYLGERAANFIPIFSQLYLASHQDYIAIESKKSTSGEPLPSQTSDDRHTGYFPGKDLVDLQSSFSYSTWAAEKSERHKAANSRYKNFWQGDTVTDKPSDSKFGKPGYNDFVPGPDSDRGGSAAPKSDAGLTKYVSGLLLHSNQKK